MREGGVDPSIYVFGKIPFLKIEPCENEWNC
jgi:hypothetical protein